MSQINAYLVPTIFTTRQSGTHPDQGRQAIIA